MELFIDLIYVAFFLTLGDVVKACGVSFVILMRLMLVFTITFYARMLLDRYSNLFYADSLVSRLLYLAFALGLVYMVRQHLIVLIFVQY